MATRRSPRGYRYANLGCGAEHLEPRALLSTYLVTNTNDAGAGSLRQAVLDANAHPGADRVEFAIASGSQTIRLGAGLTVTDPVAIDATTQQGYAGSPLVELNGGGAVTDAAISLAADGCTVRGLVIDRFKGDGIYITGSSNVVAGNYIGIDPSGTSAAGNGVDGVHITYGDHNRVGGTAPGDGNLIAANVSDGISLFAGADDTLIQGNRIGTDVTGTVALPNFSGVDILNSVNTTIGGASPGAGNLISGNTAAGINIDSADPGEFSQGMVVQGNLIGCDATGSKPLGNTWGVAVGLSSGNLIGGTTPGARNVISGNVDCVLFTGRGNTVQGNYIGTDITGTKFIDSGNLLGAGVVITTSGNRVGGTEPGAGNLISGARDANVLITGSAANSNVVQGNLIGTDVTGKFPVRVAQGYSNTGVLVLGEDNLIGGTSAAARNVISGNTDGVVLYNGDDQTDFFTMRNRVEGNYIGTDITGSAALPNRRNGVRIVGAADNSIGGTDGGAGNLISGNGTNGIWISALIPPSADNRVQGNFIGTDASGHAAIPNAQQGVLVEDSRNNLIGGTSAGARNVISGNGVNGVVLFRAGAVSNLVQGNYIGLQTDGIGPLGNALDGVRIITSASANLVGGPGGGNAIAFNQGNGITVGTSVTDILSVNNRISDNSIFSNTRAGIDLANDGVTANATGGARSGPNRLVNYPVLGSCRSDPSGMHVSGSLSGPASQTFVVELFANPAMSPSGYGQGMTYLGSIQVTTDATGNGRFIDAGLAAFAPVGSVLTATATDPSGDTSEFSAGVRARLSGDVNGDGSVSFADLLALAQHYGGRGTWSDGDVTGDGTVDFADLLILAQNYSQVATVLQARSNITAARFDSISSSGPTRRRLVRRKSDLSPQASMPRTVALRTVD